MDDKQIRDTQSQPQLKVISATLIKLNKGAGRSRPAALLRVFFAMSAAQKCLIRLRSHVLHIRRVPHRYHDVLVRGTCIHDKEGGVWIGGEIA